MKGAFLLTTQPGWAFASLRELRSLGVDDHVSFHHRDSSLIAPARPQLRGRRLLTPASLYGVLAASGPRRRSDAAGVLAGGLDPSALKTSVLEWLPLAERGSARRFSVTTELHGRTRLRRVELHRIVEGAMGAAFPRWKPGGSEGLRLLCKADADQAVLGLQLYSNLGRGQEGRPGSLRHHLACALLTVAGAGRGDTIFDPFLGTGTILEMAGDRYGAGLGIGLEVDAEALGIARERLHDRRVSLHQASFEGFDYALLPKGSRLVSNVPFGVTFPRAPTASLVKLLRRPELSRAAALLVSREQGGEIAGATRMRRKNVLTLGQPASILYGVPRRA